MWNYLTRNGIYMLRIIILLFCIGLAACSEESCESLIDKHMDENEDRRIPKPYFVGLPSRCFDEYEQLSK
jgi:hypothetical protein